MEDLIKALTIILKYGNQKYPTHCEHDCLYIIGIDVNIVSKEDLDALDGLGFIPSEEEWASFVSFRYGSA